MGPTTWRKNVAPTSSGSPRSGKLRAASSPSPNGQSLARGTAKADATIHAVRGLVPASLLLAAGLGCLWFAAHTWIRRGGNLSRTALYLRSPVLRSFFGGLAALWFGGIGLVLLLLAVRALFG